MNREELRQLISSTMQTDGVNITVPMSTWNKIAIYIDEQERREQVLKRVKGKIYWAETALEKIIEES